jgi:hypothetical protein
MGSAHKLGVLALVVLLFGVPTMACLLPTAPLTAAERECCKQMAEQCGNPGMPSSHSCCQRLANPDDSSFVVPHSQHVCGNLVIVAIEAVPIALRTPVPSPTTHVSWFDGTHGPPESPPVTTSVLRI